MSHDYGHEAHRAAMAHLDACFEAEFEEEGDTPASAPFCGCSDCVVREVLYAAWPIVVRSVTDGT